MSALLSIVLPVFLLIGFGYLARWQDWLSDENIDGLMKFAQGFAIPALLFRAISTLDLGQNFNAPLLISFYAGAVVCFAIGLIGARLLFNRSWEDAAAIGLCCLFSNTLLLGLPITERAYGSDGLTFNYAIISVHAPFCYFIGITAMEIARARSKGTNLANLPAKVVSAMFRNAMVIGLGLGFVVNLLALPLPAVLTEAIDLLVLAALPAALFGLGGVLHRYRPEGDMRTILFVVAVSLLVHPLIVWSLGQFLGLSTAELRSAVMTSAVAPGVNAYLFANMYGSAKRVAASSVLIGTAATIGTASLWILILP